MATKQGYLKEKGTTNKIAPKTLASLVKDEVRNQALSASLLSLVEKQVLGYNDFSTLTAYAIDDVVFYDRKLYRFTAAHEAGEWNASHAEVVSLKALIIEALTSDLEDGSLVVKLAENLDSWNDTENSVLYRQEDYVDFAGGTASINSDVPANLMTLAAKTDFAASQLLATGFNLLHHATAVGAGYYFLVPKLEFGTYGTADKPNGILFTDNNGQNLTPTVYFKPLSSGVPTSVTDGTACAYTDSNGHRFYTTSQAGYIIVSGITFANTCAHIGWSKRYDEFISPTDASDAGATVALSQGIHALHDYDLMLTAGNVSDRIEYKDATHITWHRLVERTAAANTLSWTDTLQEDGVTYRHEAAISGMKADGAAEFMTENITLAVSGTTVSFTDQNATVTSTDYIKYELASEVTGTATVSSSFAVEDWGLIVVTGASGEAYLDIAYGQNMPDALREFVSAGRDTLQAEIDALEYEQENAPVIDPYDMDLESLPLLCGQPMKLYAAGAPAESNVPTNWIQLADGGYNWTGLPSAIGQEYIDTQNGKKYEAVINNATTRTLKWLAV